MKKTNSFVLFGRAFKNAKNDFWVSIQVLLVVTFFLALLFYFVEHIAQPEEYRNPWDAFVWAITRYIGDPGHFAGSGPVTLTGRYIDTTIGVLKILIFAVPAGLVANGFRKAIEDDRKLRRLTESSMALHKRFRRTGQSNSWYKNEDGLKQTYKYVSRYKSIYLLQVKMRMSLDELIETVNFCPDMRLNNMSTTMRMAANPQDRLIIEHFPINTEYGCFLDRGSNVTIVSTASYSHIGVDSSAFSLAAMGGFNFVSQEIDPCPDEPFGFFGMNKELLYLIDDYEAKENAESMALHFMDDLKKLKKNSLDQKCRHWFVFCHGSLKTSECQVHFRRNVTDKKKVMKNRLFNEDEKCEYGSLVLVEDESAFKDIFEEVKEKLQHRKVTISGNEQNIVTEKDNYNRWESFTDYNIMCRIGGGIDCNAFNIRIADEILVYSNCHLLILKDIADSIKKYIEPDRAIPEEAKKCYLKGGDGFADDYGKTDVFETDPTKLRALIEKWKKEALQKFEHLDLDGNEQADYAEHHKQPPKWKQILKI